MSQLKGNTHLFGGNTVFVEELYERYLENPNSVDSSWQSFFKDFGDSKDQVKSLLNGPKWCPRNVTITKVKEEVAKTAEKGKTADISAVLLLKAVKMIDSIRDKGHLLSKLDPLGIERVPTPEEIGLGLINFGFSASEAEMEVDIKNYVNGITKVKVAGLYNFLLSVYSSTFGAEIQQIRDPNERQWLYDKLESGEFINQINANDRKHILRTLTETEGFEQFLHLRFPGAKRFSVEGGESSLVAVEQMIEKSAELGVSRIIMGMAHRGRLNNLTKILGKPYVAMLSEFQGNLAFPEEMGFSGDVKYHLGYSSIKTTSKNNKISVTMVPNPSHLETVNPVVMGKVRAEQTEAILEGKQPESIGSILIHGDAAVIGQGVVIESIMIGDVPGYEVKGTLHVVVNNQVGFTANPWNGRTSRYPTEFFKAVSVPIFHVNGDDPEAVTKVARLMAEYRQTFKKDTVMNLVCFRLHGHNESDEPNFTQPLMYHKVSAHPGVTFKYKEYAVNSGSITEEEASGYKEAFRKFLDSELDASKTYKPNKGDWLEGKWSKFKLPSIERQEPNTGVNIESLKKIGEKLTFVPQGFEINSKIARQLDQKKKMFETGSGIDWATAESLAFGSLLVNNHPVRLSGQDAGRGTFSHRHSVFHDQKTAAKYEPLNNLADKQAKYEVIDSALSEYAVMGYEYGYALGNPNALVLWEGQFGDFANGAQIIIDQYLASAERKWLRMNGLVLLLPHGYEGQGPEHSSARFERFLQLCAEDNMQVANCTTPASYFHILRRQIVNDFRKPLVMMSPKSLLRHKLVVSDLAEMGEGTSFKPVIGEVSKVIDPKKVKKVIFCTGKVYYDLYEEREKRGDTSIALIRLEQLYPLPSDQILEVLEKFEKAKIFWAQEEPKNMGAYSFIALKLFDLLGQMVGYIGRKEAASPATGYGKIHNREVQEIIKAVFES
ncbi:MAG: 2-oxoglutarate dehydrogenase E1 component [Alphaproteobacteria bacterium 33-17]|nr:MAG: 2-oxoglutarate dehydrogenase E1 component [Alphaproteobacteria bacterium 33-17]